MSDRHPEESREATHAWIKEWVGDNAYAHGLADDVFDLLDEKDALVAERDEALVRLSSVGGYEGYDDAWQKLERRAEAAEAEIQRMLHEKDEDVERIYQRAVAADTALEQLQETNAALSRSAIANRDGRKAAEARVEQLTQQRQRDFEHANYIARCAEEDAAKLIARVEQLEAALREMPHVNGEQFAHIRAALASSGSKGDAAP